MIALLDRFFDPLSLLIVVGGTIVGTLVSATRGDLLRALAALKPFFRANPIEEGRIADRAVRRIQHISEYKGFGCADRVKTPVDFVHRAACRLADADGSHDFAIWAREEMEDRRARHEAAIHVWRHAADLAPAMGMIGTVIGLTGMFAQMSDPAAMGPGMAVAMLTTLYGLLLASCLANPVATRLARLSRAEEQWQQRAVERLIELARAEEEEIQEWRDRKRQTA